MSFEMFGLGAFTEALQKVSEQVDEGVKRAVERGLALVEAKAKANAGGAPGPEVQTGTLRRGIRHTKVRRVGIGYQGEVGPTVIYSRRIDLGFVGADALGRIYSQAALPYFTPAWDESVKEIGALFAEEWRAALTKL